MKNKRSIIGNRSEMVSGNYWRRREGGSLDDGGVMKTGDDSEEKDWIED